MAIWRQPPYIQQPRPTRIPAEYSVQSSVIVGAVASATRAIACARAAAVIVGIIVTATRLVAYAISSILLVGIVVTATKIFGKVISSSTIIGNLVSASRALTYSRAASVLIGVVAAATQGLVTFRRSASTLVGVAVSSVRNATYSRTSAVIAGIVASASKSYSTVETSSVIVGAVSSASRLMGYIRSATTIVGDIASSARNVAYTRVSSVMQGVVITATKIFGKITTSSTAVGVVSTASRLAGYIRAAIDYIGNLVTASEDHKKEYYESASVTVGNLVSASRTVAYSIASSVLSGILVSASGINGFIRSSSTSVGVLASASRLVAYIRSSGNKIGIVASAARNVTYSIASSVVSGIVVSASRTVGFIRNSSVMIGIVASASKIFGKVISSSIYAGAVASASRLLGYIRSSTNSVGNSVSASRLLGYIRSSSTIIGNAVFAARNTGIFRNSMVYIGNVTSASKLIGYTKSSSNEIGVNNQDRVVSIGSEAIDRPGILSSSTLLNANNPADVACVLSSVSIFFEGAPYEDATNVKVGTFYNTSGSNYCMRDFVSLGTVTAGSEQVFPVSLTVEIGDIIGMYFETGRASRTTSGGSGIYRAYSDCFDGIPHAFDTISYSAEIVSLSGTGVVKMASRQVSYNRLSSVITSVTSTASKIFATVKSSAITIGNFLVKTSVIDAGLDDQGNTQCTLGGGSTVIDKVNPVLDDGYLDTVKIYKYSTNDIPDAKIGTFYNTGGNDLTCRSYANLGTISGARGWYTFTGLSIQANSGDYLGIYGGLDSILGNRTSGGGGIWVDSGDTFGAPNTYNSVDNWGLSFYATGIHIIGEGATRLVSYNRSADGEIGVNNQDETIDAGSGANYFYASTGGGYTRLCAANPCNASGTLDTLQFYFRISATGVKIGTFFHVSGNTYTCRDSITIGAVEGGSQQTFSPISLSCQIGDILGIYYDTGSLCFADDGPTSFSKTGDKVVIGNTTLYSGGYNGMAIYATGTISMVSRQVAYHRYPAIIEGIAVSASRVLSSTRNAAVEIGVKISASKLISYIRQSSIGQGIIVSASKAISIIRSSSIIAGIVATAKGGKSYWKDASVIVGAVVSASRIFAFVRNSAVVIGIVASAIAIVSHFGFKVLRLDRSKTLASMSRKFYSLFLDRDDTDVDIK